MNLLMIAIKSPQRFFGFLAAVFFFQIGIKAQYDPSFLTAKETFSYADITASTSKTINITKPYQTGLQEKNSSAYLYLKLDLGDDFFVKNTADVFNVLLSINVSGLVSVNRDLTINEDQPEQLIRIKILDEVDVDPNQSTLTFNCIGDNLPLSGVSAFVANQINSKLRLTAWVEREFAVDVRLANETMAPAPHSLLKVNTMGSKRVTFKWNSDELYPNYEIQLLKLINTDPTLVSDPNISDPHIIHYKVDWKNALKVETQSYKKEIELTMVEGSGYYVWRVRPIGTFYPGGIANNENYGLWSPTLEDGAEGNFVNFSGSSDIFYYQDNEENLNWIYNRVFTEGNNNLTDGVRISEGITYADPLGRPRQVQAYDSDGDKTIVNHSVIDFSGRPSLNTIAVPLASATGLPGYISNLVQNSIGDVYTAFDYDDGSGVNNPGTVKDAGTAYSYYNGQQTDGVASAEGYPFTRTIFKTDGTGRASEVSGVGRVHAIGTITNGEKRTTRILYGSVSDEELIRVFGDEAPLAESVIKMITIDPNGVQSVEYISKEGKTIASALISNQTSNLQPLNSDPHGFVVNHSTTQNIVDGNVFQSTKRFAVSETKTVTLKYDADKNSADCIDCQFAVQFYLIDLQNQKTYISDATGLVTSESPNILAPFVVPSMSKLNFTSGWKWVNDDNVSLAFNASVDANADGTFDLPEGEYLLVKKVFSQKSLAQETDYEVTEALMQLIYNKMNAVHNDAELLVFETYLGKINNRDLTVLADLNLVTTPTAYPANFTITYTPAAGGATVGTLTFNILSSNNGACADCGGKSIAIPRPEVNLICDAIDAAVAANDKTLVSTLVMDGLTGDASDGFIEYLQANELYRSFSGTAQINFLDQVAPGFTESSLEFMLTNMLTSKYYTGQTKNGSMAKEDENGQLYYVDANGDAIATGVAPVASKPNYTCKNLYRCWIMAVDLLGENSFDAGVDVMNEYNDRADTDSEEEYDEESNREDAEDKSKFEGLLNFIISRKMRDFNDSDEGYVGTSELNTVVNFINTFMDCAGYQFAAILDEDATVPAEYSGSTFTFPQSASTVHVPDIGGTASALVEDYSTYALSNINYCNGLTSQLAYPYIMKPEWMFKYFVYNSQNDLNGSASADDYSDNNVLVANQLEIELGSCYNDASTFCGGTLCTPCNYTHLSWSAGQRLNFYKQIKGSYKIPPHLCAQPAGTPEQADPIDVVQMAKNEVQIAIDICANRKGEFMDVITSELTSSCYDIVECLTSPAADNEVSKEDVERMADKVVTECQSKLIIIQGLLNTSTGAYGHAADDGDGVPEDNLSEYPFEVPVDCYSLSIGSSGLVCTAQETKSFKLFLDCDQAVIDQASFWQLELDITPPVGSSCGTSTSPSWATSTGCSDPEITTPKTVTSAQLNGQ
ncbi:MAG: hypothetical protein K0R65_2764 [Crocinitomicaceae bacterium]|jgi:hypothetical protein|nr:hypothetical protein [Crocinitomicaceae bacterium]